MFLFIYKHSETPRINIHFICLYMYWINFLQANECALPMNGVVLNHYVINNCHACTGLAPIMVELLDNIEKTDLDIKYRKVVCNDCDCTGVRKFPTVEITYDKEVKATTTGLKTYGALAKWLGDELQLPDPNIFLNGHVDHENTKLKKLTEKDLVMGLDGNWLVLFHENNSEVKKLVGDLAERNPDLSVGEIHKNALGASAARFNIEAYPYLIAMNHGIVVPYVHDLANVAELKKFVNKLTTPSFQDISFETLRNENKGSTNGEPVYVVIHKDFDVASHYFMDMAQQFKFKASIYRSNDPRMFIESGFTPNDKSSKHNELVKLFVYKNGSFYPCPAKLEEKEEQVQWIFHTHFPHLNEINNENFYSIFHGIKPVVVLLTNGDKYVKQCEHVAAERPVGAPFSQTIFAVLDDAMYPGFRNQMLSKMPNFPFIAVFNPIESKWHYKNINLSQSNIKQVTMDIINEYFNKTLLVYPPKESYMKYYVMSAALFIVIFYLILVRISGSHEKE